MLEPLTTGLALGATPTADGVEFAVWSGGEQVEVCVFDDERRESRQTLTAAGDGLHTGLVRGIGPGVRYGFRVDGPWRPEHGDRYNPAKLLLDPYALAIEGELDHTGPVTGHAPTGALGGGDLVRDDRESAPYVPLSVVVAPELTIGYDWGGDAPPCTPWADTVIYEAHVRGLTRLHPDVPEHERGTYAGLAHPAVVAHLQQLGVTAVELLPVHQFLDESEVTARLLSNYWGYNSVGFFAPHAAYSSVSGRGEQVGEFKDMVRALHRAGLEVILDVVYNHTPESDEHGPTLSLRGLGNREYYHLRDGGRRYVNTTGCGNTLNLGRPRTLQLVLDSLRYWVTDMHVDGFRFDLAPALARVSAGGDMPAVDTPAVDMHSAFLAAVRADPVLSQVKLIAEPWDIGPGGYQSGNFPPEWTEWNDRFRDTVRDFWRGMGRGVRDLGYRLSGSSDLYRDDGRRPFASINFITAHDGFTLRDLVSYDRKHNDANGENGADGAGDNRSWNCGVEGDTEDATVAALRRRQLRNLAGTLLLSTGVPMLVAGDEIGRTQRGNNNAYCQDNELSWVDWTEARSWEPLRAFVERTAALRRRHATLRQPHYFDGQPVVPGGPKDLTWLTLNGTEMGYAEWHDDRLLTLGLFMSGDALRQLAPDGSRLVDDSFLLWLHAGVGAVDVRLPAAAETVLASAASTYVVELDTSTDDGVPRAGRTTLASGESLTLEGRSLLLLRVVPTAVS